MKGHLGYLLGLAAITLASCAAFFSVYGLSQLFAGASLAVIIMSSTLEFSKLVIASYLHSYWSKISKIMKIYFTIGVVTLVLITSAGIYGFLSNAYQKTANNLEIFDGEVLNFQNNIDQFNNKLEMNQKSIDLKYKRVNQLNDLRINQENRLNENNSYANRNQINNSNKEIEKLNIEIDQLTNLNSTIGDSITTYKTKIIGLKSKNVSAGEIGPLKYISELSGAPMNKIVNYFILLLVFVFDPLAICLVIASISVFRDNKLINVINEKQKNNDLEVKSEEFKVNVIPLENNTESIEVKNNAESIETKNNTEIIETKNNTEPIEVKNNIERKPIKREDIKEVKQLMNRGFTPNYVKNNVIFDKTGRRK